MMEDVAVSVIVPVYNVEMYLEECLTSLSNQSMKNAEFICVDDGSTDGSLSICKKFLEMDERFVVISQENSGPAKARNEGRYRSRGKYLCFGDSDDRLEPGALSKLYDLAESKQYDIVVHGSNLICDDDVEPPGWVLNCIKVEAKSITDFKPKMVFEEKGCRPFLWMHFIRSDIIKKNNIWINEKLKVGEDQAFEILYFSCAKRVLFVEDKLYNYRISRSDSIMSRFNKDPKKKMWQHIEMLKTVCEYYIVLNHIEDSRKEVSEWILDTMYWDLERMLYHEQIEYTAELVKLFLAIDTSSIYYEMDDIHRMMYNEIKIIEAHRDNPDSMIIELTKMRNKYVERLDTLAKKPTYPLFKRMIRKSNKEFPD